MTKRTKIKESKLRQLALDCSKLIAESGEGITAEDGLQVVLYMLSNHSALVMTPKIQAEFIGDVCDLLDNTDLQLERSYE